MCSVQYRRLTSKAWSTTCSFIQDTYVGSASIRAFNVVEGFREKISKCTDTNIETDLVEMIANRYREHYRTYDDDAFLGGFRFVWT